LTVAVIGVVSGETVEVPTPNPFTPAPGGATFVPQVSVTVSITVWFGEVGAVVPVNETTKVATPAALAVAAPAPAGVNVIAPPGFGLIVAAQFAITDPGAIPENVKVRSVPFVAELAWELNAVRNVSM
jgi:hypothetical protein